MVFALQLDVLAVLRISLNGDKIAARSRRFTTATQSASASRQSWCAYDIPPRHGRFVNLAAASTRLAVDNTTPQQDIKALLSCNQVEAAVTAFELLVRSGTPPPPAVSDALFERLLTGQRHMVARNLYFMMQPNVPLLRYRNFHRLIRACLHAGASDEAISIFRGLQAIGLNPNKVTYCELISALGKQRRRGLRSSELAYELWGELCKSTEIAMLDSVALRTGMKACVDVGRLDEAEELLRRIETANDGAAPDVRTYNILLHGHAAAADRPGMVALLERMKSTGVQPSCATYNTLIGAHVRAGELKDARQRMVEAVKVGIRLDAWSYTALISGYVQQNKLSTAMEIFQDMRKAKVKPTNVTYSTLIDGYVEFGDTTKALQLFDEMVKTVGTPSTVAYNSLLKGYARMPKDSTPLLKALQLLDDMQVRNVAPNVETFNTLMSAAVDAEEPKLALNMYDRLRGAGLRPDGLTYTILIKAHARLGQMSDAVGAFEALSIDRNAAMDVGAYNAMVDAFARTEDMAAAESMLRSACNFARNMGNPVPVEAYGAVVAGYVRLKLVHEAVDAVRRFHAAGGTPDMVMLDQLADICVRSGEFKLAMQAVRAMELLGGEVDKKKYKNLFTKRISSEQAKPTVDKQRTRGARNVKGRSAQQTAFRESKEQRNVHVERFKFWLGLPNKYYDTEASEAEDN